jgi:HK97 family phage prohead protease
MDQLERRAFAECRIEPSEDNARKMTGYAVVFNSLSENLGGFREIIKPEAVDRTLSEGLDVRALVDHDTGKIIGRTRAGTLTLRKRTKGLYIEVEADPEISYASDILRAVKRGDVTGMSFGFRTITDNWRLEDEELVRDVLDMRISEVSIVTFPAYTATDVQVAQRSLAAFQQTMKRGGVEWRRKQLRTLMAR